MNYLIRPMEPGDAAGFAALRRIPAVYDTLLAVPSETDAFWVDNLAASDPDYHGFVAVLDDGFGGETLIGAAGLQVMRTPRKRHRGDLGVMIHPDYQNMGVATALMERLLDLADNWLMLVRVELDVFPDNAAALHLYEKLGFEREGVLRKAAVRNGRYEDLVQMSRIRPAAEP